MRAPSVLPLLVALGLGCGADVAEAPRGEREGVLGDFLAEHWKIPAASQGALPREPAASLDPRTCGACHPQQFADWSTSLHAAAVSPGLLGQLVEGALSQPHAHRMCMSCHAPLDEQQVWDASGRPNPRFDPALRPHGVFCAGCHVRQLRFYGPPPRPGAPGVPEPRPHGGFEAREEYRQSRFCAECHQFFDDAGVNGKPLENTFAEWRASPQAAEGRQCQDCHMPDRRHLWRGIHDPDMVRQAVDVDLVVGSLAGETLQASLVVRNRDVGHAFPTYVTPRVFVAVFQADAGGAEFPDTRVEAVIAREVDLVNGIEIFDTRVLPGESVRLEYAHARVAGSALLVGRVAVDPDHHYRGVFRALRGSLSSSAARAQMEEAAGRIADSSYVLTEIRRPLPD